MQWNIEQQYRTTRVLPLFRKCVILPLCLYTVCACRAVPSAAVPEWVHKPPAADSLYEYFTATGTGCGAAAEQTARRHALNTALTDLGRYLGTSLNITAQTVSQAAGDTSRIQVETAVSETAQAHIEQCKIIETFTHPQMPDTGCVSVSLLVRYDKTALAAERSRLDALHEERENAIRIPEEAGDRYAAAGRPDKALPQYIEAARAAAHSTADNAALKYERNIRKARDVLTRISMKALSSGQITAAVNQAFPSAFEVQLYTLSDSGMTLLADMPVLISYTAIHPKTGRKTVPVRKMRSSPDGRISFIHPPQPTSYKNGRVVIALDIDTLLLPLRTVPGRFKDRIRLLLEHPDQICRITFEYDILGAEN